MRPAIPSIIVFLLFSTVSFAHSQKGSRHRLDISYPSALATANRFLHAWQSEDHETGIVMLTDSARQHTSPEQLQDFFSPGANAAYEIARGTRTKSGGYAFPVVLFGTSPLPSHLHASKIVVTRDGKSDWAIDKLP